MSASFDLAFSSEVRAETDLYVTVHDYSARHGWQHSNDANARALRYCRLLEQGEILFFRHPPFALSRFDCNYLMEQSQSGLRLHKNISYRSEQDLLRGFAGSGAKRDRTRQIMRDYSGQVTRFLNHFLIPYTGNIFRDYASFRPLEEEGRALRLHKRNDLLHIDAFPTRPTHGGRILRVFTNIHPHRSRVWRTDSPFSALADRFATATGLQNVRDSNIRRSIGHWLRLAGVPVADRSPYDRFMRRFHDFLKENVEYQTHNHARRMEFPPMSTWMIFTDGVAHAVLSGRFALEQTFIVPLEAQVAPEHSPLRVLEQLAGHTLV